MGSHHTDIRLSIVDPAANVDQILAANSFSVILWDAEPRLMNLSLPERAAFAYLSPSDTEDTLGGRSVFCKYRSGETLYRIILDLFSTVSSNRAFADRSGTVYMFAGAGGGVGATTLAVAFAKRLAAAGTKTMYINLDKLFDSSLFFDGDSIGTMSDLIFAVVASERSRSTVNLSAKAQALLSCDSSGVYYIKSCENPYEFNDLDEERINALYSALTGEPQFGAVIIDVPAHYERGWALALEKAGRIIAVTEGRAAETAKLGGFLKMLNAYESHSEGVLAKTSLIVNRGGAREQGAAQIDGVPVSGYVPRYNDNDVNGIVNAVARLEMWDTV